MNEVTMLTPVWLTIKLASMTTLLLLLISLPLAWWLSRWQHPLKAVCQAIVALPLVLPPTVLGFYLLMAFAPDVWLGRNWLGLTGQQLAFSFEGILLGSMVYSLPFAVQPLLSAFSQLQPCYLDVAHTLGLKGLRCFVHLVLPLCRHSLISAAGLTFAHTIGEFGVVLMVGGNIPGETQVVSIALFDYVETMDYASAHLLSFGLLLFSMLMLTILYRFNGKRANLWN